MSRRGLCQTLKRSNFLFVNLVTVTAGSLTSRCGLQYNTLACQQTRRVTTMATETAFGGGKGVTVEGTGEATAAVVFLHGLGDTGAGWAPAFPLRGVPHVRAILPTADVQPVTLNGGFPMPSWFDLFGLDEHARDDSSGIEVSVNRVNRIIDSLISSGIPSERIVLAGFSQGGAVALTSGLRSSRRIAGIVALSTWLPLRNEYPSAFGQFAKDTPIFAAHGQADPIVPFHFGRTSANLLNQLGVSTSFHSYPGLSHSASEAELEDVVEFIKRVLPSD